MPVADPSSGRLFVWLTSCFLFISITAGGSCLLMYILLPQDPSRTWLPIAGVTLVCLPWLFWFITCFYRVISRACGFRVAIGFGNANDGGGGGNGGRARASVSGNAASNELDNPESPMQVDGDGRHVQFGGAFVLEEENDDGSHGRTIANKRNLSASNSGTNMSVMSHESELPLTSSMAS